MPYITEPPWARWSQLVALAGRYALLLLLGLLTWDVDGYAKLLQAAGAVVAGSAAVALVGIVMRSYRLEWVMLPPLITALLWVALLIQHGADFVVTLLVVGLAVAQADRLVYLTRVASKLRALPKG
ncbi:MAG: hypothetical protein J0I40_13170 [Cellulomonas sp.]|uniref:hypothetical protein n=1 Tax=Cellulomonas sp. 73-92 TaxID=1895740 RepID=UPI000A48E401|nr:hypothetical protein [Cellulomonas sp. 73-92]MBN9376312.1 hypothetical protein [Cellulomonas sp.]